MTFVDDALSDVSAEIDNALQGLCQWFKLGWGNPCIQPPIPFNMSFLSPGTFNIFGCTLFQDKWLPVFFFPWTVYVLGAPIPLPYWLIQSPTDSFYRAPWWAIPSMIRLYVSPTLTAQLWFAICLWPQAITKPVPQPIRDLWWNCIVLSLAIPCGKPSPQVGPNQVYTQQIDERWIDAWQGGTCTQATIAYTESTTNNNITTNTNYASSPFKAVAQDPFVPSPTPIIPQNTYGFGLIGFDTDPVFVDSEIPNFDDFIENIKLKAWGKINLKILGWMAMGLVKCLVQDWMDRQIKYIINNMSQMTVGVYFPNLDDVFVGFDSLNTERLRTIFSEWWWRSWIEMLEKNNAIDTSWLDKISNRVQNNIAQQWHLAIVSEWISNPFELAAKMFEEVNLITITNRDVVLSIPFIYSEDLIRYISYLETWMEANGKIFEEWRNIVRSAVGICLNRTINDSEWNSIERKNATMSETRAYIRTRREALNIQLSQAITANNISRAQEIGAELDQLEQCDSFSQNARFQQFLNIEKNYEFLVRDIRQNLKILEQYQQFPLQLYEWMHVTDRYLTELSWFIGWFFGEISYWLGVNAKRFSQYIDAIITLIGVIQTRQALIDISVNWAESCGTCSNDIYDYYSCSLAFLCPKLPILPIPPFKLPNIYLDMSRINIGMQILLPRFRFVPTAIALPRIPDLPKPPRLSLNIDFSPFIIPDLPLLPAPPMLPTLPPLIPQVYIDLPVLPPAPKIPAISPSIRATITAAEFIGKIMCIIKGKGIWLVAEDWVKSKIEQMTQRSWNVPFFDYINLTTLFRDPPLQWFDYQIDTFINIQFNFNGVYDIINYMATEINRNVTTPFTQMVNTAIEDANQTINNNIVTDFIQNNIQNNINIDINLNPDNLLNRENVDIPEVDYAIVQKNLLDDLVLLEDYSINNTNKQDIGRIQSILAKDNAVIPHLVQLKSIEQQVQTVVSEKIKEIQYIQKQIVDNYDDFLNKIWPENIALIWSDDTTMQRSLALFGADNLSKKLLQETEHPILSYLNMQDNLAQWYQQALTTHNPVSLWIDSQQHQHQQRYFAQVRDTIAAGKQLVAGINTNTTATNTLSTSSRSLIAQQSTNANNINTSSLPLIAQTPAATNNTCINCGGVANTAAADLTQYAQGIWVQGNNGQLVNVVMSNDHIQSIGKNYMSHDINGNGSKDIIMRDAQNIYIKYANQNSITNSDKTIYHSRYYVSSVLNDPSQLSNITDNRWYIAIVSQWWFLSFTDTLRLKIYDKHWEVKNFRMAWQSFDDISLSRSNNISQWDIVDGYLIQLNHRVDTHNDKYWPMSFISNALINRVYVLALPEGTVLNNNDLLRLPYNNNPVLIRNLINNNEIVDIFYYDPNDAELSITLVELSRHWKYAQISTLQNTPIWSQATRVYERASPWSNQVVAWPQILDDTIWPIPTIELIRNATNETISQWTEHQWYVSTNYTLDIQRADNVAVAYNWIEDENANILQTFTGSSTAISWLFFTGITTQVYTIWAIDYNGNFNRTTISLSIDIPMINIDAVYKEGITTGSVIASISQDMDEWFVSFERMRTSVWQTMTATQNNSAITEFPLDVWQTIVTWSVFDLSDDIALYNAAGVGIATLNPVNGTISIWSNFLWQYALWVNFVSHVPMIKVLDIAAWQEIFQIYYAPASLYGNNPIQISDPSIVLEALNWNIFGWFNGWRCMKQNNNCISYISSNGHIYVPTPHHISLHAEVIFAGDYISYIVKNSQNIPLYSINFVMQPLVGQ